MKLNCTGSLAYKHRILCPFPGCLSHSVDFSSPSFGSVFGPVERYGRFFRRCDSKWIQRFRCHFCRRTFSKATVHPFFRQKKTRRLNRLILTLFASGVSQRRVAKVFGISKNTAEKKFIFLGKFTEHQNRIWSEKNAREVEEIQFDELETFEQSKLKPVSVPLAVDKETRAILSYEVGSMQAKGIHAKRSVKKYGKRLDQRKEKLESLLKVH
jgi:transposase-like protein